MKIGFYLVGNDPAGYVCADMLIQSVRKAMPGVPIVHLSDEETKPIPGVDLLRYQYAPQSLHRVQLYALAHVSAPEDWLFLDTDCVVNRDVSGVFADNFDIAVCDREGTYVAGEAGSEFMKRNPYNMGVVFSRSGGFWNPVQVRVGSLSPTSQAELTADQVAMCAEIKTNKWEVKILPGLEFNYPPKDRFEDVSMRAIVHYKGPSRKKMLLEQAVPR